MRNIYVLPTDKPSRLIIYSTLLNEFRLLDEPIDDWKHKRNIYITSDEEIKDCFVLNTHIKQVYFLQGFYGRQPISKKIILTTDQDLIKDGVQPIDDEFLEWFVKNPSCEFVETDESKYFDGSHGEYLIIIPQKELKQENCRFCEGTGQIVSSTTISGFKTCDCIIIPQEEPKQDLAFYQLEVGKEFEQEVFELGEETLFQPIEPPIGDFIFENANAIQLKDGYYYHYSEVCKLIKLQAKKMYSKEEVIEHLNLLIMMPSSKLDGFTNDEEMVTMKWFEQFKKL